MIFMSAGLELLYVSVVIHPPLSDLESCARMTIGCRVDRLEARTGAAIELNIVVQNDSPVTVNAMHIKMKQQAKWTARSHESSKTRTLASVQVPGSELGGAGTRAIGSVRGQCAASIAEAAREDVQQGLVAGKGTRYTLLIPPSALLSIETDNIEIIHYVSVKLKTTGFNSSPEVSAAVHVRPPPEITPSRGWGGSDRTAVHGG